MNFRPLHDRVLVRRVESDEKTPGGIIIPDTAQEKPMEGEVLEVGSGARDENGKLVPLDVKKGDKIQTEISNKFTISKFNKLAKSSGWHVKKHWKDTKKYYAVFLLQA